MKRKCIVLVFENSIPNKAPQKIENKKTDYSVSQQKKMYRMKMRFKYGKLCCDNFENNEKSKKRKGQTYQKFHHGVKMNSHCCIVLFCNLIVNLLVSRTTGSRYRRI